MEYITFDFNDILKIQDLLTLIEGTSNIDTVSKINNILIRGEKSQDFEEGIISFRKGDNPVQQKKKLKEKKELKITLSKIVGAYYILEKLNNDPTLSFKIHYWCMRNNKAFTDSVNFFQTERNKLYVEYAKPNEEPFVKSTENPDLMVFNIKDESLMQEFVDKFNELQAMECDIEPYKIDAEYLFSQESFNVSGQDIYQIDFLIDDSTIK